MTMLNYKGCVPKSSSRVTCGSQAKYLLMKMLTVLLLASSANAMQTSDSLHEGGAAQIRWQQTDIEGPERDTFVTVLKIDNSSSDNQTYVKVEDPFGKKFSKMLYSNLIPRTIGPQTFKLMMAKGKTFSRNYELKSVTTAIHKNAFEFKKGKALRTFDFSFTINSIKDYQISKKSGLMTVLLGLTRTGTLGWMKGGACNRWLLLDHAGIQFLKYCATERINKNIRNMIRRKAAALHKILDLDVEFDEDIVNRLSTLKLRKKTRGLKGKGFSWSYEVRNVLTGKLMKKDKTTVYRFQFVDRNCKSRRTFEFEITKIVAGDSKDTALIKMSRKGLCTPLTVRDRYLFLDKEGIAFLRFCANELDDTVIKSNQADNMIANTTFVKSQKLQNRASIATSDEFRLYAPMRNLSSVPSIPIRNNPRRRTTVTGISPAGMSSTLMRPAPLLITPTKAPMQSPVTVTGITQNSSTQPRKSATSMKSPVTGLNDKDSNTPAIESATSHVEAASQAKQEEKVEIVAHAASTKENLVEASPKVAKQVTVLEKKQKELLKKLRNAQSDLNLLKSVEPKAAPGPEKRVKPAAKATCTVNTWECSSCKKNKTCEKSPKTSCRCIGNGTWKLVSRRRLASHRRRLENRPIHMLAKLIQQAQA